MLSTTLSPPLRRATPRWRWAALGLISTLACAPAPEPAVVPPAPILFGVPEPAFDPARQCRGAFPVADLERYLARARLVFWLPGAHSVEVDAQRGCLTVTVEDVGTGRLAELILRGVAVPRRAVLLQLGERAPS